MDTHLQKCLQLLIHLFHFRFRADPLGVKQSKTENFIGNENIDKLNNKTEFNFQQLENQNLKKNPFNDAQRINSGQLKPFITYDEQNEQMVVSNEVSQLLHNDLKNVAFVSIVSGSTHEQKQMFCRLLQISEQEFDAAAKND